MSIENPMPKSPDSSGVLCVMPTYRFAGAGGLGASRCYSHYEAMLLRWSKEFLCIVLGLNLVAFNNLTEVMNSFLILKSLLKKLSKL